MRFGVLCRTKLIIDIIFLHKSSSDLFIVCFSPKKNNTGNIYNNKITHSYDIIPVKHQPKMFIKEVKYN